MTARLQEPPDLDEAIREYRECSRHVWNTYFQPMVEGWHEFINVERALFDGLVVSRLRTDEKPWDRPSEEGCREIGVVPQLGPRGLSIMCAEPKADTVQWMEEQITSADLDLRFLGFFDFASYTDPHDLRYVRAEVLAGDRADLVGKEVLLEVKDVRFEERDKPK